MIDAIPTKTLPSTVTLDSVQHLSAALASREEFLRQLVYGFEHKHKRSLDEFNQQLETRQVSEHPAREDLIEWGNASDQLAQVELMRSILAWLTSLLKPSASS